MKRYKIRTYGIIGVPHTFINKWNKHQFEIIGVGVGDIAKTIGVKKNYRGRTDLAVTIDNKNTSPYLRLLIKRK